MYYFPVVKIALAPDGAVFQAFLSHSGPPSVFSTRSAPAQGGVERATLHEVVAGAWQWAVMFFLKKWYRASSQSVFSQLST
jgi:hypothetical protein